MARLRDQCDETVGLHARLGAATRTVLDQVQSSQPLRRTYTEIGMSIPIYQGAPGKVLLAFSSPQLQEEILAGELEAATPRTITDPKKLRVELQRTRKRGYAFSFEERVPGISTLAVPVFNHKGGVAAALSVTGPSSRVNKARLLEILPLAIEAARAVSANLGYVERGDGSAPS